MNDYLKVAKECGATLTVSLQDRYWVNTGGALFERDQLEAYTSSILASQQAAHDAEISERDNLCNSLGSRNEQLHKELSTSNERIAYLEGLVALQDEALKESSKLLRDIDKAGGLKQGGEQYPNGLCCHDVADKNDAAISASAETVQAFRDKLTEQAGGTTGDKYRAELYDEVWNMARSMGFANVTDALVTVEPLRREVAALHELLARIGEYPKHGAWTNYEVMQMISNTQATAQACEQEAEARGAVKALESFMAGYNEFDIWLLWSIGVYANGFPMIELRGVYSSEANALLGSKVVRDFAKTSEAEHNGVIPCQRVQIEKRVANHTYAISMQALNVHAENSEELRATSKKAG